MIEFKALNPNNKNLIYKWFDKEDFYYDTHLPMLITKKEIDEYFDYPDSYANLIYVDSKPIGLCDFMINKNIAKIEIQLVDYSEEDKYKDALFEYCRVLFENYNIEKISKYVYEFDSRGVSVFERSGFFCEGEFNKFVYKNGKYWNVKVYSILRCEFEEWEKEECLA